MCFYIDKEICPKALIAEKDIRVYKQMAFNKHANLLISPIQEFEYKPNRIYKTSLIKEVVFIHQGFHAFRNLIRCSSWTLSMAIVLCEFIIPKGSKYYFNDKEIVSNKIYWTGRVYRTDRWVKWNGKITKKIIL